MTRRVRNPGSGKPPHNGPPRGSGGDKPASGIPASGDGWGGPAKGASSSRITPENAPTIQPMSNDPRFRDEAEYVRAHIRPHLREVIEAQLKLARDPAHPSHFNATQALINRVAPQETKATVQVRRTADELSDDELAAIAAGGREQADPTPVDPAKPKGVVH